MDSGKSSKEPMTPERASAIQSAMAGKDDGKVEKVFLYFTYANIYAVTYLFSELH